MTPMILKRNPEGPLTIRCDHNLAEDINQFLVRVTEHAYRWETLILGHSLDARTMQILQRAMPALKTLQISDTESDINDMIFPVSETPRLEHIDLSNISLDWTLPSLPGLKFLSIYDLVDFFPTLHEIVAILQASPALECLILGNLGRPAWDMDQDIDAAISGLPSTISLSGLRGLIMDVRTPPATTHYLASSIDAPDCRTLQVNVSFDAVGRHGSTFPILSAIPIHSSRIHTLVCFQDDGIRVQVSSQSAPDGGYGGSKFTIEIPYDMEKWAFLIQAIGLPIKDLETTLLTHYSPKDAEGRSIIQHEHIAFWHSVEKLEVNPTYSDAIALLGFLRSPRGKDGKEKWVCLGLKDITFFEHPRNSEAVGKALVEVVEGRYLASKAAEGQGDEGSKNAPVALRRVQACK